MSRRRLSREIVHAQRIANISRLQDQFKYLARRVTLVKITKPDCGASHAGEKSSLVGYKRTPCSTPSPPIPLLPLFLRCKLVRVRRCKIDNGVVANRMPRYESYCSGNEFFPHRSFFFSRDCTEPKTLLVQAFVAFIFIWFRRLDNASTKFFNDATRSRRGESYRSLPTSEKETQRYDKRDGRVKGWIRGSLDDCWLPC